MGQAWAGRPLHLKFPATVEHAPDLAQTFVDAVAKIDGVQLDYSDASLEHVDTRLGLFGPDGSDAVAETVLSAGCYIGEVMVRVHGFHWTMERIGLPEAEHWPVVARSQGSWANPIAKAFKRVDNGSVDNVPYFVRVFTQDDPADEPPAD